MIRSLALAWALLFTSLAMAAPSVEEARNLTVLKQYGELGRQGDYAAQAALWSPDAINNGRPMSPAEIRSQLEDIHRVFPDHQSKAVETTAAGDLVIVLTRTSGTHQGIARTDIYGGMLKGATPLGRHFDVLRAHWWRFRDGKIVWHQVVSDDLNLMKQLGLIPATLAADKLASPTKD
ncbi:MAG TPA: ester cyclase [Steroidobacteraceae bacterium]|nr:ester cyclase [Steroidobacteraceae bacterium]